jgi:hypothetical protein
MFDNSESVGVTIWRDWCKSQGCTLFINHYPDFYPSDESTTDRSGILDKYYIPGDVHFNEAGNKLIATRLIDAFRDELQ